MTRTGIASLTIVCAIVLFALACLGFAVPLQGIYLLAFGWILFLWQVLPNVNVDGPSAATGAIALALLVSGLHWFLRWFSSAFHAPAAAASESTNQPGDWHLRWTASIVTIVVMMFVAGVSMVGITHEIAWLATSRQILVEVGPRVAARRMKSSNHLKQMTLELQNYSDAHGAFPGTMTDERGQATHGWQFAILPELDPETSKQIDRNQPWDSRRNAEALKRRVPAFLIPDPKLPTKNAAGYALSHYAGNVHVLGGKQPIGMSGIKDETSNTLLIGEAAGNYRPWGHPHNNRDPMLGINKSPDGFGSPWPSGVTFSFADGHTQYITNNIDPQILRALATPAGGETIGDY